MRTAKNVLVEKDLVDGCSSAIVDHHEHGRILLREMKSLEGDNYGYWSQGFAAKLLPADTLESLDQLDGDLTIMDRLRHGYDEQRPLFMWSGFVVESVASSVGL